MQDIRPQDRRRSRRLKIGQPLRLRPSDPSAESFEEIGTTRNVARDGFYFLTRRVSYREGMRLFVTVPYHSPADLLDQQYLGQVIRVELLDDGQRGVAVQLLSSLSSTTLA
ncbi:MAG: hypothetical protein PVS2B2_13400 [Candidatus Acidiferrum sp.]